MSSAEPTQETQTNETAEPTAVPAAAEQNSTPEVPGIDIAKQENASEEQGDAPSSYEPFTLPENVTVADEDLAVFTEIGNRLGLDQAGAQELVDLSLKVQEASLSHFSEALESYKQAEVEGWQAKLQSDEKLGGDNLADTEAKINAFVNTDFVSDELFQLFQDRSLFHNPAVAGFFAKLGAMIQEDSPGVLGNGATDGKTSAQRMFGNSTPN